jgi:tetratricopeptide (TPR) repeat protein
VKTMLCPATVGTRRTERFPRLVLLGAAAIVVAMSAACAPKAVNPPSGAPPRYPDFMFPVVPVGTGSPEAVTSLQRGWRLLQAGDLRSAEQAFGRAIRLSPSFYPAETGLGYVKLAGGAYDLALASFGVALGQSEAYVPALVGRGEALVGAGRPRDAIENFSHALALDPSLTDIRRRVEVIRLRLGQDALAAAKQATTKGDYVAARQAYEDAIAGSPDSAFLYRDLAEVERLAGRPDAALQQLRKAADLDPSDVSVWMQMGRLLEERKDPEGAVAAYARAVQLDPGTASAERLAHARRSLALANLPEPLRHIPDAEATTRGDLAALIGTRLAALVTRAPVGEEDVITDIGDHWAATWIRAVARAGLMDVYPNHEFQPEAVVRRADLAQTASRVLELIGRSKPRPYQEWQRARPSIADVPPGNVNYASTALVVTAGVIPLLERDLFMPLRPVSGAEALDVLGRLEVLSR